MHILQAAREEAGQMLADHRIGCVGQAEFLQSGPPCLARQVVESGPGKNPSRMTCDSEGVSQGLRHGSPFTTRQTSMIAH